VPETSTMHSNKSFSHVAAHEPDIFNTSDCRVITITTKWSDSTVKSETEKRLCVD